MRVSFSKDSAMPTPLVSTDWLADHLEDGDLRIIDCSVKPVSTADGSYSFVSGRDDWAEAHIPGAVFCDVLGDLTDRSNPLPLMMPSASHLADVMGELGIGDGTRVVLYDRGIHAWAARVWWSLRVYGFDQAAVLDGGWSKWLAEGRPTSDAVTSYPKAVFKPRYRPELIASKAEVVAAIGDDAVTIVHSLSPGEFTGEVKRFRRPGRIAGSVNVPIDALIDSSHGGYLSTDALAKRYGPSGAAEAERVITYCGGGVAACSNALSLVRLGHENVAVYDGSLEEWTADPDAPMETG